jgi:hypothetical protein
VQQEELCKFKKLIHLLVYSTVPQPLCYCMPDSKISMLKKLGGTTQKLILKGKTFS